MSGSYCSSQFLAQRAPLAPLRTTPHPFRLWPTQRWSRPHQNQSIQNLGNFELTKPVILQIFRTILMKLIFPPFSICTSK